MKDKIISYYNRSNWLYKYFWYNSKTLGLHFGLDDKNSKNLSDSIENQYKILIKLGKIKKGMKVLDAGCGVGGASIYLAHKTGANLFGISLVPEQIKQAKQNAAKRKVADNTTFLVMDFTKTSFPNNYFDVIFGIESICHAYPKEAFLIEAKRILKPGGKLIIADGYRVRKEKTKTEKAITKNLCSAWSLNELIEVSSMVNKINSSGFSVVKSLNKTASLSISKRRFWLLGFIGTFFQFLPGVKENVLAIKSVLKGLRINLFGYYIHVALKRA